MLKTGLGVFLVFLTLLWGYLSATLVVFSSSFGGGFEGIGGFVRSGIFPSMAAALFFLVMSGFLPIYSITFWVGLRWLSMPARIAGTSVLFLFSLCVFFLVFAEDINAESVWLSAASFIGATLAAWVAELLIRTKVT